MLTSDLVNRLSIAIFILSSIFAQLVAAVPLVLEADHEARIAGADGNGFNVYLGTATWNTPDDFYTHDPSFAALAQDAFKIMRAKAQADGVQNPARSISVLLVGNKAYFSSSVTNVLPGTGQLPGDLLKMFQRPLYSQEGLGGPTPDWGKSTVLEVLGQCLKDVQTGDPKAEQHEMFCGEPIALEQFYNDKNPKPPRGDHAGGFRGLHARVITWGIFRNGQEGVFDPCTGGRDSSPNAIGCRQLVRFLALPVVTGPQNPASSYPQPDSASSASLCIAD